MRFFRDMRFRWLLAVLVAAAIVWLVGGDGLPARSGF